MDYHLAGQMEEDLYVIRVEDEYSILFRTVSDNLQSFWLIYTIPCETVSIREMDLQSKCNSS